MKLATVLQIQQGITAVIGGGGKTTLLRTLGEELAQSSSVLLCTTTKIMPFQGIPWTQTLAELEELHRAHRLLCMGTLLPESGKLTAPQCSTAELLERFDYVLVEADGAAHRPLKAHAAHEPVIPAEADQVICVVGASGFGQSISVAAHRPELYARLAGTAKSAAATAETELAVLRAEALHDRIYVNQIETRARLETARLLASGLNCPVVAGSLQRGEYFECLC